MANNQDKSWQDWLQWIGSIILIPLIAVVTWTVFENKSAIAVFEARQSIDQSMIKEIRDDVKNLNRYFSHSDARK